MMEQQATYGAPRGHDPLVAFIEQIQAECQVLGASPARDLFEAGVSAVLDLDRRCKALTRYLDALRQHRIRPDAVRLLDDEGWKDEAQALRDLDERA